MARERLKLQYVALAEVPLWDENPKRHDLEGLKAAIRTHGFLDPPRIDATLGAVPAGNGRIEALREMERDGDELPRGIALVKGGGWAVPVVVGCDAETPDGAIAYGIDHNNLVAIGGLAPAEVLKLWDAEALADVLERMERRPVTMQGSDLLGAMAAARKDEVGGPEDREEEPPFASEASHGEPEDEGAPEPTDVGPVRRRWAVVIDCDDFDAAQRIVNHLGDLGYEGKVVGS